MGEAWQQLFWPPCWSDQRHTKESTFILQAFFSKSGQRHPCLTDVNFASTWGRCLDRHHSWCQAPPLAVVRRVYGLLSGALMRPAVSRESRRNLEEARPRREEAVLLSLMHYLFPQATLLLLQRMLPDPVDSQAACCCQTALLMLLNLADVARGNGSCTRFATSRAGAAGKPKLWTSTLRCCFNMF